MWIEPIPCPNTVDGYINEFSQISRVTRDIAKKIFNQLQQPIDNTEECLEDIKVELNSLLIYTNKIVSELPILSRKQQQILYRVQRKNEALCFFILDALERVIEGNYLLYEEQISDYLAEEIPYQKNFSVILKNFLRYRFQEN